MLFSPTMEHIKSKNPELNALLPYNMYIMKNKTKTCLRQYIYMYNIKTGDFLDKSFSKVLKYGDSIPDIVSELTKLNDMYIKNCLLSPDIVLDDPRESTWLKKISNPLMHKKTIIGISFVRSFTCIYVRITNKFITKTLGREINIPCKNIYNLENCINEAIEIINSFEQPKKVSNSILIEDRIYIKTDSLGTNYIICNMTIQVDGKSRGFGKSRSLHKYSFDDALQQAREFRDMKIKELNLRPARPLTDVDIFNIQDLKAKYDKLKPEQTCQLLKLATSLLRFTF